MTMPELLRSYAQIFDLPVRDPVSGTMRPPGELSMAAANALRFQADALDGTLLEQVLHQGWKE